METINPCARYLRTTRQPRQTNARRKPNVCSPVDGSARAAQMRAQRAAQAAARRVSARKAQQQARARHARYASALLPVILRRHAMQSDMGKIADLLMREDEQRKASQERALLMWQERARAIRARA